MNLQHERIRQACEALKLNAIATEWPGLAERTLSEERSLADFLEALLQTESEAIIQRTQAVLLKFAGLPAIKHFEDYDFKFATGAPQKQLQSLQNLSF
jgi:DNA replication protein DnaC